MADLKVDDLYIGKRVYVSQLNNIHNTLILLTDCREVEDDIIGTVAYITINGGNNSVNGARICVVYNEKSE